MHCCLCLQSSPGIDGDGTTLAMSKWDSDWSEVAFSEISLEEGRRHGASAGGYTLTTFFRVCPTCFHAKVIPWFVSQGARPTTYSIDL